MKSLFSSIDIRAVIMEPSRMVDSVRAEYELVQNNTRALVFNNARITINSSFPEVLKISGLLCDRQLVREVLQGNRGCGCYSMNSCILNIEVAHSFNVSDDSYQLLSKMDDFSHNQSCRLFLNCDGYLLANSKNQLIRENHHVINP